MGEFYLNLAGVVVQSTHIFLPMMGGFGSLVMSFQSMVLLKEFGAMNSVELMLWTFGIFISFVGTVLIGRSSDQAGDKDTEHKELDSDDVGTAPNAKQLVVAL